MSGTISEEMQRQIDLEARMRGLTTDRYFGKIDKAKERQEESQTSYSKKALNIALVTVTEAIENDRNAIHPGKQASAWLYLREIDSEMLAYFALRGCLDSISVPKRAVRLATQVAQMCEDELRCRQLESETPELWRSVDRQLKHVTVYRHKHRAVSIIHGDQFPERDSWSTRIQIMVGLKLVSMVVESTGLFKNQTTYIGKRKGKETVVAPTDLLMELIDKINDHAMLLQPDWLPLVVPPKDWSKPVGGGYYTDALPPLRIIKTRHKGYLEELESREEQMQPVYAAINALQRTAWRINEDVLEVMLSVWDADQAVGGLPQRDDLPLPPKPADIDTNSEAKKAWKREATAVYTYNAGLASKRLQVAKTLYVAGEYRNESKFYYAYQMDFRGRLYPLAGGAVSPQGSDYSKALLTFTHGKPITNQAELDWLLIHGANTFGEDKLPLADRIAWVQEHEAEILEVGEDPLSNRWWTDADKPWCFLAFCIEYWNFKEEGWGFVSTLPVAMDGSNNGLQHFAAMLRDPVSGAAVNLTPSGTPQDIYQEVAKETARRLERIAEDDEDVERRVMARSWLRWGVDRGVCKRPVMVLPYGGTLFSAKQYVLDYIQEQVIEKGKDNPWQDEMLKAANFLAGVMWKAIGTVVVAAREAMDWLREMAAIAVEQELPLHWTTPIGLPILQAYPDLKDIRITTRLAGKLFKPRIRVEAGGLDKRRQVNGVSPNFVHSLDASVLMATVNCASAEGINSFAMIHDSYGTVSADCPRLAHMLRQAFVDCYRCHDVLAEFAENVRRLVGEDVKLPPIPAQGVLDIEQVSKSLYFFA